MYSREHPWLTISKWIYANIPTNAAIAVEHWDDVLPAPMRTGNATHAPSEYKMLILPMYDVDDATKLETLVNTLTECDYIILATHRLSTPITRLPQRYPISSRYYDLLFGGQLGFELVAFARNDIALGSLIIQDERFTNGTHPGLPQSNALVWNWGYADESFTVYDHPLPLVFQKTHTLSHDELRARIAP